MDRARSTFRSMRQPRFGVVARTLFGLALFAVVPASAADFPHPEPSRPKLPFLRRYAKPVAAAPDRTPATAASRKAMKRSIDKLRGTQAPGTVKKANKPEPRKARAATPPVRERPAPGPVPRTAPPARTLRQAAPVAPPATPVAAVPSPTPARQPARVVAPSAYSGSPTNVAPNMTTSTSILPFHPSTPGRAPPPKTQFLDMTRRYSP